MRLLRTNILRTLWVLLIGKAGSLLKYMVTCTPIMVILAISFILFPGYYDYICYDTNYLQRMSVFVVLIGQVMIFRKMIRMGLEPYAKHESPVIRLNSGEGLSDPESEDKKAKADVWGKVIGVIIIFVGSLIGGFGDILIALFR